MPETASTPRETSPDVAPETRVTPGRKPDAARRAAESLVPLYYATGDERLLAWTRLGAALALVLAAYTGTHGANGRQIHGLVLSFAAYAVLVVLVAWKDPHWCVRRAPVLHAVDFAWAIVATSVSGGTQSNVFLVFSYVLAAAALRWGLAEVLREAAVVLIVVTLQAAAAVTHLIDSPFEPEIFIVRVSYAVVGIAVLVGIISERHRTLRFQAVALADLVMHVGRATRLGPALLETLTRVLRIFDASRVSVVIEEEHSCLVFLWHAERLRDGRVDASLTPVPRGERQRWVDDRTCEEAGCELRRPMPDGPWMSVALRRGRAGVMRTVGCTLPDGIAESAPWKTMLTARLEFSRLLRGKVYVYDPRRWPRGELQLRFLARLAQETGPALLNLYLLRRLRSRAEAHERARISRELHDGVLQSLAGLEMRLDVVRRQSEVAAPALTRDLSDIRDLLHDQALEARELMQRLRSTEVDMFRLHGALADIVDRFSRMAGIAARLDWQVDRVSLSPQECNEVVRIVQEALFNVRRHSGASRVLVRVQAEPCIWTLIIDDNGRGLGFTGRLTHEQLETAARGPRVIRERVDALGGALDVESSSAGTRLEMTFPHYRTD